MKSAEPPSANGPGKSLRCKPPAGLVMVAVRYGKEPRSRKDSNPGGLKAKKF